MKPIHRRTKAVSADRTRVDGSGSDITDHRRVEEALRESEEKYRSLVSNIPDVSWTLDSNQRFVFISSNIERLSGYSPDEIYQQGAYLYLSSLHPDDVPKVTEAFRALFVEGRPFDVEVRAKRKDGQWRWLNHRALATYERNGIRYADGLLSDITERKRAEDALRQSEAKLREALLAAQMGVWEWTVATDSVTWDENLYRIAGRDPKLPAPNFEEHPKIFAQESWERLKSAVENALATGAPYELDLDLIRPDGSKRWLIGRGDPLRDVSGRVTQLRGTVQDITERKQAEEALRRRAAFDELMATILGRFASCAWYEVDSSVVDALHAVAEFIGADHAFVIMFSADGTTWSGTHEWCGPDVPPRIRDYQNVQLGTQSWSERRLLANEIIRLNSPDDLPPEALAERQHYETEGVRSALDVPIKVAAGVIKGCVGFHSNARPITWSDTDVSHVRMLGDAIASVIERKRTEEALRESERKYRELVQHANSIILHWTRDGRVLFLNEFGQRFFGYTEAEICGRHVIGTLVPETESTGRKLPPLVDEICSNPAAFEQNVNENMRRNGERVWIAWTNKVVLNQQGQVAEILSIGTDITARKRAEEALRARETQLSLIHNHSSDGMFALSVETDDQFRVISVNHRFTELIGLQEDQVVSKLVGDIIPGLAHPPLVEKCKDAIQNKQPVHWEAVNDFPAGRKSGEVVVAPVFDASGNCKQLIGTVHDITERKRAEEELRRSESKYRTLVETSQDVIWSVDSQCRITFISPAARGVYGYEPEELLGHNLTDLVPPEWLDRELQEIERVMVKGASRGYEHIFLRKDGTPVYLSCNSVALRDDQGHVIGAMGVSTDISERKRAEEELRAIQASLERRVIERTAELAVARDRAEMADRTKSAFLATMSHELRTPLNSIIGFTGLLLQGLAGPLNAEQAKQLGMVKESGQHLLALINDVLDISKIEAGQIEIANAAFDLPLSIQKVLQTVTPLANKKHVPLIAQIAPDVRQIISDRRRVEQILLNLLSNAIKFTERGEVTLKAELAAGTGHIPHAAVRFSVADTGIGIQREDLDKLFQPFRQLDTGLTRQHEGTGLGLAICKRLVERLGGTITVESDWGKGSTFHCALPIHPERKS